MNIFRSRVTAVLVGAVAVVGLSAGGAVAGDLITGRDIANGTVRGVDIDNGTVRFKDLSDRVFDRMVTSPNFRQYSSLLVRSHQLEQVVCANYQAGTLTISGANAPDLRRLCDAS